MEIFMAKNEKRSVAMDDGRMLTFGKIQKVKKEITLGPDGRPLGIRFDGDNGQTVFCDFMDTPDAEWLSLAEPTGTSLWAAAHGYSQKIGDAYAGLTDSGDCILTVVDLWKRLCKGQWQSDVRGFAGSSLLLEAILSAFPDQNRDDVRTILGDMSAAERTALQISDTVKPHFDRLQAERAKGDTGELLAKFKKA